MKKLIILLCCLLCVGCGTKVKNISADKAYDMMDEEVVIIDVRTVEEYYETHIKNAINIPVDSINKDNIHLPSKDAIILVYCQSGNRSKQAASKLIELGYTEVYDFGGLVDWPYETVTNHM